jgi:hypothetical protein
MIPIMKVQGQAKLACGDRGLNGGYFLGRSLEGV